MILTVQLEQKQAVELAQFCRRVSLPTLLKHSCGESEAYQMLDALDRVGAALAVSGYNPK